MADAALAGEGHEGRGAGEAREDAPRHGHGAGEAGRLRLLGVAGRAGSGKSTLARALAARWGFGYVPIAAPIKGMALHVAGLGGYFPQWAPAARGLLQDLGTRLRRHDIGVLALKEAIACGGGWVVPDVRYRDELELVRSLGGEVVFVGDDGRGEHESEQLDPDALGLYRVSARTVRGRIAEVESYLSARGWLLPEPREPAIYLGGSIWGADGSLAARQREAARALRDAGFRVLTHADAAYGGRDVSAWDLALEGSDLVAASRRLVALDLAEIARADGGLVLLEGPSIGSAMEILALALSERPVAVVVPTTLRAHPWLNAMAKACWGLGTAITWLRYILGLSDLWPGSRDLGGAE